MQFFVQIWQMMYSNDPIINEHFLFARAPQQYKMYFFNKTLNE